MVKSIPRSFENSFFKNDLLLPYVEHMRKESGSLLVRITDFLECMHFSIGTLLGLAPTHHLLMENILRGKEHAQTKWETYDLKPMSYFYPERDIAQGVLTSEATKSKLADDFNEKIVLTLDVAERLRMQLQKDTGLLADSNAVDYSLFFVRIPITPFADQPTMDSNSWRSGLRSADGKYLYRAAILDFFWAKHKVHAKAMTGLIESYNLIDRQGPMSVTAEPHEVSARHWTPGMHSSPFMLSLVTQYRTRFLKMVTDLIEIREETLEV